MKQLADIARRARSGRVLALTGAGISAESGIPTFRGPEGYWTVGSEHHHPEDLATFAMFARRPDIVWPWYLYRRTVCRGATPNAGHEALARLQEALGDRFVLVTQNVDGLHVRAGSPPDRTWEIHGNIDRLRCAAECGPATWPIPETLRPFARDDALRPEDRASLRCVRCGGPARPHVLWFDECYDEPHFRWHSAQAAAAEADVMLVVGTSGATNLPMLMGQLALAGGCAIIDVNPARSPFSAMAEAGGGVHLQGPAAEVLPGLVETLIAG